MGGWAQLSNDGVEGPSHAEDSSVELGELKGILVHRRGLILGTAVLLAVLALVYGLVTPPLYSATAEILIDPRDRQIVSNAINPSTLSPDGGITQVESQVAVVQSNSVLLRAIETANLTADPHFNRVSFLSRLKARLMGQPLDTERTQDEAKARTLDQLRRNLSVKRADKVLVIDVTVTAQEPAEAARLANIIADSYLADQSDARADASREAAGALTARLAEQRAAVQAAEDAVEKYRNDNNLISAGGVLVSDQALADINTQLANARNVTAYQKARVDQIQSIIASGRTPDATGEVMRSTVISSLRDREAALDQRISEMTLQLGARHPTLQAAQAQKVGIERQIRTELARIAQSATADYNWAKAAEDELKTRQATLESQTRATDQVQVRLRELERDRDAVREVYANYLKRSQEVREQSNIDSTNARVISRAIVPIDKKGPPTPLLAVAGFFGGLGLGAALALLVEYASPTALSERQVRQAAGAPVLAVLPGSILRGRQPVRSGRRARNLSGLLGLVLRRLSTSRRERRSPVSVVLLCSAEADARARGRVASELAATAASRGERVLLIDADLMHSRAQGPAGLIDVLSGESRLSNAVQDCYDDQVRFMAIGGDRAVLKERDALRFTERLWMDAADSFDIVVVDAGDLTTNLRASALVATAEDILVVARLRSTPLEAIRAQATAAGVMGRDLSGALVIGAGR
ncbi:MULTISPECIES: GumC family protein [unclassified Aureimonas]|uniref:GumC family protein n=1 Tax=unclassified Aureimonas TaxID=2615206 RepID=UPI000782AA23|nr:MULTISPECIES: exopolysaccharide transport family protein [unclassified Aureimonas]